MNALQRCCTYGAISAQFFIFGIQSAVAGPVDDLRAATKELKSLQGEFTQSATDNQGKPSKTLSGKFALAQGSKFRFEYEKPYKQTLVSDGATFSTYDADLAQMTVRKLDDALAATPLAVLSGNANIDALFTLKAAKTEDGLTWVDASPKQTDGVVNDLRFGMAGAELRALAWTDTFGKRTVMRFSNVKRNAGVDAATFSFTPPAGTDIVGAK